MPSLVPQLFMGGMISYFFTQASLRYASETADLPITLLTFLAMEILHNKDYQKVVTTQNNWLAYPRNSPRHLNRYF